MLRQRVRLDDSRLAVIGRVMMLLFALALIFYGATLALLVAGVSPASLDRVSGFRTAFDSLDRLGPADFDTQARLIVGCAGLVALLVFGFLAWKQVPRPYRARSDVIVAAGERGTDALAPRALERIAELAALEGPHVSSAKGRVDDDEVVLSIEVTRPEATADALEDAQRRVRQALEHHSIPPMPVNVTLTGLARRRGRELQ